LPYTLNEMKKEVIKTSSSPSAVGPYSQAIKAGNLLFVSGQIPLDPATGNMIEDKSITSQTRRALTNLQGVLAASGATVENVVRTTVFMTDLKAFAEMNAVYAEFFQTSLPARSTVEVTRLPKDVNVEIDCIAVLD
jgi:2-iminobutanoate/2-iminopropanoate deaminase